ncbi:GEVED domain-containing protein [Pedobacter sp. ASV28]|uniref:GEVED domain-containing protein n=1 Tax=Pedobacter sp. ASV28 TaxID=2795123 RepID=UPI0018EB902C|nr:GEVED domain-containing protein [Pedobacter sp. ASV28]
MINTFTSLFAMLGTSLMFCQTALVPLAEYGFGQAQSVYPLPKDHSRSDHFTHTAPMGIMMFQSGIATLAPPAYCTPVLNCTDRDNILKVVFAGIDNTSTCGNDGYNDYTSLAAASVTAGQSYPIAVSVGNGWSSESVSVWIDYNDNGIFENDEFTFVGTGSGSTVSANIPIRNGVSGIKRMRVRVAAVGAEVATWAESCDSTQEYGETEDYSINIIGTLPVSLTAFTVKAIGNNALLQWQTASEHNNAKFIIYRSNGNGKTVQIGEQSGAGTSGGPNNYSLYDRSPVNGVNYYQLLQVDHDGSIAELGLKSLSFNLSLLEVKAYPNPTAKQLSINFAAGRFSMLQMRDLSGKVLQQLNIYETESSKDMDLGKYPSGIYLLSVEGKGHYQSIKVVKR